MRVKLKEVASYINGKAFKPSEWVDSGLPIIRIQNLNDPSKEYNYYDKKVDEKYIINSGDILISWSASLDIFEWKQKSALLNQHIFKVVFDKELEIDKNYFIHAIKSVLHTLERYTHGSTMKHIVKKDFENIEIPLPPLPKQKAIAQKLDLAQKLITLRKESIGKLDVLAKSVFVEMFGDPVENPMGWEVVKLKDLTLKIGSGSTPRGGKDAYKEEGLSLIRSLNIHDNKFKYKNLAFIDDAQANKLSNVIVEKNDVLLNITGASVCRCAIVPNHILPARVNQHVAIIRANKKINSKFLLHLFISYEYKQKLMNIATSGGATREAITKENLELLTVIVPPLEKQNKFAKTIQQIEIQKALYEKELVKLQESFDGLLAEHFDKLSDRHFDAAQ